jgi:hypothetical protein
LGTKGLEPNYSILSYSIPEEDFKEKFRRTLIHETVNLEFALEQLMKTQRED